MRETWQNCGLLNILNKNDMCGECYEWVTKRPRLAKQREVVQFIDVYMKEFPYTSVDKIAIDIKDCGGRERPDVLWDLESRIVILEIDEDQHKDRPYQCEQTRMVNISQAFGCERTIWIRYNPDSFKSIDKKKWNNSSKRHSLLKKWLNWAFTVDLSSLKTISVVYLFFDGFCEGDVQIKTLL